MPVLRSAALVLALAGLGGLAAPAAASAAGQGAGASTAAPTVPTLVQIRAAHHQGFDRLVFEFNGPLPARHTARYVTQLSGPSGKPVHVVGSALLAVVLSPAAGHDSSGHSTYGPARRTYALPGIIQVVNAEDFEAVLSFGVGVSRKEPVHVFTLTGPSRVVVDIKTPFSTVNVRDFFLNIPNFNSGHPPFTTAVRRPVISPAAGFGALQRLFAGPARAELASGLGFVASKATGFKHLQISDGVARVQLTGGCDSGGSAFTVFDEISPTLKQFAAVHWVKVYDPAGNTERPAGHSDSRPVCLEP